MPANLGPQLTALLQHYGLMSLADWASRSITLGLSPEEIELQLYDRPEFQAAFPEIEARRKMAEQTGTHMAPISADDILNYRAQARAMMRGSGLPSALWGQDADFFNLIVNDVSLDELNTRLTLAERRVWNAAPDVRDVFGELTGMPGEVALFTMFVDPTKAVPWLEEQVQQAEAGGAARRFGFNLGVPAMSRIAGLNLDYGQVAEGFAQLDVNRGLFEESLFEEGIDFTAEEEGIASIFGLEGGAVERLGRRAETRTAQTKGQAGGEVEERGVTSLGGAGRR